MREQASGGANDAMSRQSERGEEERLVVALVRGVHGLNGAVRAEVLTDRPEELDRRTRLGLMGRLSQFLFTLDVHSRRADGMVRTLHRRGLHVAEDDMGKVIGRNGSVAKALRTLLKVTAARDGEPVQLEIL